MNALAEAADVESQVTHLPGLACLNYPNTIQPIADKLPRYLQGKWEKEVAKRADNNGGAYPGFEVFSRLVQEQARIKNNPNILAAYKSTPAATPAPTPRGLDRRALRTDTVTPSNEDKNDKKRCVFHERDGHDLAECKAFGAKSLGEKTDWIFNAGLCFRCLSGAHKASVCKKEVLCSICGDDRHIALLHKEKTDKAAEENQNVDAKCTAICNFEGGISCSKILLVDVSNKDRPDVAHRVYTIIDDQSNSSLISTELADELGADGAEERYYLSTCSSEKEMKYGRRVTGLTVRSLSGATSELPTLIECDNIPRDKREIPTPEMARRFPHLQQIASEIPPIDDTADIHLLIGRDAPELLKVKEFKNGSRGAPWAQRLSLGWTITGQMCLDLVGGPAHVRACRTSVHNHSTSLNSLENTSKPRYELEPCPNQFRVTEDFSERGPGLKEDVFHATKEDTKPACPVKIGDF